jgi:hypothetical protein
MGSFVPIAETFRFRIGEERLTLFKKSGESYEHVLMKALGYALFRPQYPQLEIERRIGLRYKPDLIALDRHGKPEFWGECGQVALFKFNITPRHFIEQVRSEIEPRYRPAGRLLLFNFTPSILQEAGEELDEVPSRWYIRYDI